MGLLPSVVSGSVVVLRLWVSLGVELFDVLGAVSVLGAGVGVEVVGVVAGVLGLGFDVDVEGVGVVTGVLALGFGVDDVERDAEGVGDFEVTMV